MPIDSSSGNTVTDPMTPKRRDPFSTRWSHLLALALALTIMGALLIRLYRRI